MGVTFAEGKATLRLKATEISPVYYGWCTSRRSVVPTTDKKKWRAERYKSAPSLAAIPKAKLRENHRTSARLPPMK